MYKDVVKNPEQFSIKTPKTLVPSPSAFDYENGFIERFFVRVSFDTNGFVYEVDEKTYNTYDNNPFWTTEKLYWRIVGPIDVVYDSNGKITDMGVRNSNKQSISIASLKIKNISLYLPNLLQFYK